MNKLRMPLAIAVIGLAALTTACAPEDSNTGRQTPSSTPSSTASPTATPSPAATPAAPTCDNILTPEAAASFADAGWTSRQDEVEELVLGSVPVPGSIGCLWGDFSTANDNVSWLAWGALDKVSAENAIAGMLAEGGWRQEEGPEGIYITEEGDNLFITDEDGYGRTFLFGDEQVKGATTRAELELLVAPPGFHP